MNILIQRLKEVLSSSNDNLREKIFVIINLVAAAMAIGGLLETVAMVTDNGEIVAAVLLIFLVLLMLSLYITLRYRMLEIGSIIVDFVLCFIVFPAMFFTSGGINGGATVYFSLNIIYTCIMFQGKMMYFSLFMDILADIIVYGIAYNYPEYIMPLDGTQAVILDSMYSVIVVGVAVGIMLKLHINEYAKKQKTVELQKEELIKAAQSKDRFFASMSHEIRTPINTIMGLNEMIIRDSEEEETIEYAEDVRNASKMLLSLVNDILDMTQMEMGKMEIVSSEYSTVELLNELVNMIRVQADKKKLALNLDFDSSLPRGLFGDKKRIQQILINILNNAVKYTEKGSITFSVKVEDKSPEEAKIAFLVQDTGIGIRKEDIAGLYDLFNRVDVVKNHTVEGSGLGLAITKQLTDLMGGELSVDSIYTKGSIFTVVLRQKIVDATEIGVVERVKTGENKREAYQQMFEAPEAKILIVDDNIINIKVASKLLEKTRVQLDFAYSGKQCLEKTQNHFYDIILLDHIMPEMDGIETLAQIRKQENGLCRDTVIIAMTANAQNDAISYYRQNGFDMYVEKPIVGEKLEQCIMSFLPPEIIEYRREVDSESGFLFNTIAASRKKRVMITTDCVAELDHKIVEQYGIGVMYLYIKTDKGRFADTREISSDNLSNYIKTGDIIAKGDSASVEEYEQFFAESMTKADEIIHISMSSGMGKSYGVAQTAAQSFGHVHVIDSKQLSCGLSLLVLQAAKLAQENAAVDEIIRSVEAYRNHIMAVFIMPTMRIFCEHGYAPNRLGKIVSILGLHPCFMMSNGKLKPICFYRGDIQVARKKLVRRILKRKKKINTQTMYISHVMVGIRDQEGIVEEIDKMVSFENKYILKASFSNACNSGVGTMGFAYYKNE